MSKANENSGPLNTLGGRKYSLVVGVLTAIITLSVFGIELDAETLSFIKWIVGLYMAGNVGKGVVDKFLPTKLTTEVTQGKPTE